MLSDNVKRNSLIRRISKAKLQPRPLSPNMVPKNSCLVRNQKKPEVSKWSKQQLSYWLVNHGLMCLLPLFEESKVKQSRSETRMFVLSKEESNIILLDKYPIEKIIPLLSISDSDDLRVLWNNENFWQDFIVVQSTIIQSHDLLSRIDAFIRSSYSEPVVRREYDQWNHYIEDKPLDTSKEEKNNIVSFLMLWAKFEGRMELFSDTSLYNQFLALCDTISQCTNMGRKLKSLVKGLLRDLRSGKNSQIDLSNAPEPVIPKKKENLALSDIHPKELARQITLLEEELFLKIQCREFLNQAWNKKKHEKTAPNITLLTRNFNKMINWFTTEVLKEADPVARSEVLSKFIKVAKHMFRLQNYNGVMQVLSSLHSSTLTRLKQSWALIAPNDKAKFDELTRLMSSFGNFKTFRKLFLSNDENTPCIPFLGVFLTDCTYLDDLNEDRDENGWFNWNKAVLMSNKIREIMKYRSNRYVLVPVTLIQHYIKNAESWSGSEALYAMSLELEKISNADGIVSPLPTGQSLSRKIDLRKAYSKFNMMTLTSINLRSMYLPLGNNQGVSSSDFTSSEWKIILAGAQMKTYDATKVLQEINQPMLKFYRIHTGIVAIKCIRDNTLKTIGTLGSNEMFCEVSLLAPSIDIRSTRQLVAVSTVQVYEIPVDFVLGLMEVNPTLCGRVHSIIAIRLAKRLKSFQIPYLHNKKMQGNINEEVRCSSKSINSEQEVKNQVGYYANGNSKKLDSKIKGFDSISGNMEIVSKDIRDFEINFNDKKGSDNNNENNLNNSNDANKLDNNIDNNLNCKNGNENNSSSDKLEGFNDNINNEDLDKNGENLNRNNSNNNLVKDKRNDDLDNKLINGYKDEILNRCYNHSRLSNSDNNNNGLSNSFTNTMSNSDNNLMSSSYNHDSFITDNSVDMSYSVEYKCFDRSKYFNEKDSELKSSDGYTDFELKALSSQSESNKHFEVASGVSENIEGYLSPVKNQVISNEEDDVFSLVQLPPVLEKGEDGLLDENCNQLKVVENDNSDFNIIGGKNYNDTTSSKNSEDSNNFIDFNNNNDNGYNDIISNISDSIGNVKSRRSQSQADNYTNKDNISLRRSDNSFNYLIRSDPRISIENKRFDTRKTDNSVGNSNIFVHSSREMGEFTRIKNIKKSIKNDSNKNYNNNDSIVEDIDNNNNKVENIGNNDDDYNINNDDNNNLDNNNNNNIDNIDDNNNNIDNIDDNNIYNDVDDNNNNNIDNIDSIDNNINKDDNNNNNNNNNIDNIDNDNDIDNNNSNETDKIINMKVSKNSLSRVISASTANSSDDIFTMDDNNKAAIVLSPFDSVESCEREKVKNCGTTSYLAKRSAISKSDRILYSRVSKGQKESTPSNNFTWKTMNPSIGLGSSMERLIFNERLGSCRILGAFSEEQIKKGGLKNEGLTNDSVSGIPNMMNRKSFNNINDVSKSDKDMVGAYNTDRKGSSNSFNTVGNINFNADSFTGGINNESGRNKFSRGFVSDHNLKLKRGLIFNHLSHETNSPEFNTRKISSVSSATPLIHNNNNNNNNSSGGSNNTNYNNYRRSSSTAEFNDKEFVSRTKRSLSNFRGLVSQVFKKNEEIPTRNKKLSVSNSETVGSNSKNNNIDTYTPPNSSPDSPSFKKDRKVKLKYSSDNAATLNSIDEINDAYFRKTFHLDDSETLLQRYNCVLKGKHGVLYVSANLICFNVGLLGFKCKEVIPFVEINKIEIINKKLVIYRNSPKPMKFHIFDFPDDKVKLIRMLWKQKVNKANVDIHKIPYKKIMNGEEDKNLVPSGSIPHHNIGTNNESIGVLGSECFNELGAKRSKFEFTSGDWETIIKGANVIVRNKDESIICEGDQFQRIFRILRGTARIEKKFDSRVIVIGHLTKEDDVFGEISFLDGGCATASIFSDQDDTAVYIIEGYFLSFLFERNQAMSARFHHFLASMLYKRVLEREADSKFYT